MEEKYIKLPLSLLKGNSKKEFTKFSIRNKYNYLTKDDKILSKVWFSKAENDFTNGYAIVNNGTKSNLLNENGELVFQEWCSGIERISASDNLYLIERLFKESGFRYKLYSTKKGFLFENRWHCGYQYLLCSGRYFVYIDYKLGETYKRLYSYDKGLISEENFSHISYLGNDLFHVTKRDNGEEIYNILDKHGNLLLNEWSYELPKVYENHFIYQSRKNDKLYIVCNMNGTIEKEIYVDEIISCCSGLNTFAYKADGKRFILELKNLEIKRM